jgi:hypothetical protein
MWDNVVSRESASTAKDSASNATGRASDTHLVKRAYEEHRRVWMTFLEEIKFH